VQVPLNRGAKKTGIVAKEQGTCGPYKDKGYAFKKKKLCPGNMDWKINTVFYNDLDSLSTLY
jgi:hypothetical protein